MVFDFFISRLLDVCMIKSEFDTLHLLDLIQKRVV